MFVPLHTKSDYSAGYGSTAVERLVARAADLGFPAIALTDIENMYGQVRLHHAARAHAIQAITGVELRGGYGPGSVGSKAGRVVLLARSSAGYRSLCRIVTGRRGGIRARTEPTADPLECLAADPVDLFFLSDDASVIDRLQAAGVPDDDVRFLLV